MEQKAREASTLVEIEKKKAQLRILAVQNNNSAKAIAATPVLAGLKEKGETRDKVAQKIGFKSGHEAERAIKTVKKIDELKQNLAAENSATKPLRHGLHFSSRKSKLHAL